MRFIFVIFTTSLSLLLSSPVFAHDDQSEARCALASGEIIPLKKIIENLEQVLPNNDVIKVKFERDDGLYIYKLKVIDAQGVVREVEINAKTGQILEIEVDD